MKKLGYPKECKIWIRLYYSAISDWNKDLILKAFCIPGKNNTNCIILVATDAYGIDIDNLDIKFVVQWDLPISFDSIIQCMGRAEKKGVQQAVFVF